VILHPRRVPDGIDDSKKLTAKTRERLEAEIKRSASAWAVAFASVEEIAELNILHATGLAMRRAVEALELTPAFALVDGNYRFALPCQVRTVVGGDALSASIAAASILAKTARDRLMAEMDELHPGYGFASHKGYGAARHIAALQTLGPSPIHRMSWAPLRLLAEGGDIRTLALFDDRDEVM
jgi:ribonuclease HII